MKPSRKILVLGATSAIARATALAFARRGDNVYLAARDTDEVSRIASDLALRCQATILSGYFDATDTDTHELFIRKVVDDLGGLDGVVFAAGSMAEQTEAAKDFSLVKTMVQVNYLGAMSVLNQCASYLKNQRSGFIIGISSVAGDRGRQSNYYYGSTKSAFTVFLAGLRNALQPAGVHVMTVKPGFVDTAMTYGVNGMFLVASPDVVGERIAQAVDKKRDIVYLPWFWRYIMLIIRFIPESIFKRLKL